jgi:hypothetical protein
MRTTTRSHDSTAALEGFVTDFYADIETGRLEDVAAVIDPAIQ